MRTAKRVMLALVVLALLVLVPDLVIAMALRLRGENPSDYIGPTPSLWAIVVLAIMCWLLRGEMPALFGKNGGSDKQSN